ncbi:hypothetical protein P3X46_010308 [Hevea brasiliensis]|uniref:Uncharacterized protein n=1 Tax=Hevea brasiliensis TaxID=3981 RepID=A0ABQ9MG99_HEVBR|nr:hypothetical protein P3X46_010308 [Hevea brasiliensis]
MLLRGIISHPLPSLYLKTPLRLRSYAPIATTITNKYSISNKDLESQGFLLRRTISNHNLDHLNSVFMAVSFPKHDPEKIKLALENTNSLLWVEHKKTQKLVAFARVTGDNVFNAIIWDVC